MTAALTGVLPGEALGDPAGDGRWASLGTVPEAVVSPKSADEAATLLAWASAEGVAVVPAGSGRHLGVRTVAGRCVVLTSDRMTGLEIYEPADLTFTAKAGTSMREIDGVLRENGQWLPFDPPDVHGRTLGGLVAAGLSGPLWMGYGAIRNHVLGMTVVTGDGRVLRLGGRVVKNVAGFDLIKPIVGSRGRLAFIASVCMRAFPEPAAQLLLRLRGERIGDLLSAAGAVRTAPVMPVSSVVSSPASGGGAELLVRLHGRRITVEADRATLESFMGVALEVVDEGEAASVPHPPDDGEAAFTLTATFPPARLGDVVPLLESVSAARVSIDTYAARASLEPGPVDTAVLASLRPWIESLGGALAVERAPPGAPLAGVASEPTDDERVLAARVSEVFDREGVLWRGA